MPEEEGFESASKKNLTIMMPEMPRSQEAGVRIVPVNNFSNLLITLL